MQQPKHGGNLAWAAALAGCPPDVILDFSASISPLGPPNSVLAAISSQLNNLRHYPDPNYCELRLALSHFHKLSPEWILPGNGSAELLSLAGRELAQLAATVLIAPAFGDYYRALSAYDAKVLECPVSLTATALQEPSPMNSVAFLNPLSEILDKVQRTNNKGLLLNNPHNPTGKLFSREAILPYLEKFALVVIDEAFMDFLPPEQEQSAIAMVQEYPNLAILRSLTKFYSMPGLRLGYAIAHPARLQRWQSWRDPWPVNTLAAAAASAALQDKEFQAKTWAWLPPTRNQLFEGLASFPELKPLNGAANFLLVESQSSVLQLQQKLLKEHRILIRDCLSFPELGDRYFRIAVLSSSDNQRLLKALSLVISH
jgi:L-threonine-O-3-phosphate decarboxylase